MKGGEQKFAASEGMAGGKFSILGASEQKFAPSERMAGSKYSILGASEAKIAPSERMAGGKFSMAGGTERSFAPSEQMAAGKFWMGEGCYKRNGFYGSDAGAGAGLLPMPIYLTNPSPHLRLPFMLFQVAFERLVLWALCIPLHFVFRGFMA